MNTSKKSPLGRGLGALIEGVEKEALEKKVEANLQIEIDAIDGILFSHVPVSTASHLRSLPPPSARWALLFRSPSGRQVTAVTSSLPVNAVFVQRAWPG